MDEGFDLPDWLIVSRETHQLLVDFFRMVLLWNEKINLVSNGTLADGWTRHVIDSAQVSLLDVPLRDRWLDLGSGAGFPGMIVAILGRDASPSTKICLVESDRRKATFLSQAARQLGLKVEVKCARVESMPPESADVISARALAPLTKLIGLAVPHLRNGGKCLFMKGRNYQSELAEAGNMWKYTLEVIPSRTEASSVILRLGDIRHA